MKAAVLGAVFALALGGSAVAEVSNRRSGASNLVPSKPNPSSFISQQLGGRCTDFIYGGFWNQLVNRHPSRTFTVTAFYSQHVPNGWKRMATRSIPPGAPWDVVCSRTAYHVGNNSVAVDTAVDRWTAN
jgi:hypothetical protein